MVVNEPPTSTSATDTQFDYVIVGSGAGGSPLAARLAEYGHHVLVLEAGPDHAASADPSDPDREITSCPALHAPSSESSNVSWAFFVDHYPTGSLTAAQQDSKWNAAKNGIFYPRATGIGGCTIHNAMITIVGPAADWDALAWYLNDPSWGADVMRGYFRKLERCEYQAPWRRPRHWYEKVADTFLWLIGQDQDPSAGRHGFDGWLHTSTADPSIGLSDKQLVKMLKAAVIASIKAGSDSPIRYFRAALRDRVGETLDPNHFRRQNEHPEGVGLVPTAIVGRNLANGTARGRRSSPAIRLKAVANDQRYHLTVAVDCLATKLIFDSEPSRGGPRAVGVEFLHGKHLYKACPEPKAFDETVYKIHARREVILCGGAFNTPQLLMLSGIGPAAELSNHNISCRIDSPGVGRNLQDRYEVTIVSKMREPFTVLDGALFKLPVPPAAADPKLSQWRKDGSGLYSSNGAVLAILKRSRPELDQPDLFIFGIPLKFLGYQVGYSVVDPSMFDLFTWAILKGHTRNHDGVVTLNSDDPTVPPKINFNYFGSGSGTPPADDPDLNAVLAGVKFVRGIASEAKSVISSEFHPAGDMGLTAAASDQQLKEWIRQVAWGHHACGTCRMGRPTDSHAVVDSQFRVLGDFDPALGRRRPVRGLRVVDASIFPTIPGYFIVSNLYMASEKAADVIDADR